MSATRIFRYWFRWSPQTAPSCRRPDQTPANADRRTSVDLANVSSDPETWEVSKKQVCAANDRFWLQFQFKHNSAHPLPKPHLGARPLCFARPLWAICCGHANNLLHRTQSSDQIFSVFPCFFLPLLPAHLLSEPFLLLHFVAAGRNGSMATCCICRLTVECSKFPLKSVGSTRAYSLKACLTSNDTVFVNESGQRC